MDDGYIYGHFMIRGEYIGNEKKMTVWYSQGHENKRMVGIREKINE